jgi:hypothetical protein
MLYERVGEAESLENDALTQLEAVASEEVRKAVDALREKYDASENDLAANVPTPTIIPATVHHSSDDGR